MSKAAILNKQVGPRDGEQFENIPVSVEDNLKYIDMLVEAGETFIEFGSLASKSIVPMMANSEELALELKRRVLEEGKYKGVTFSLLVMSDKFADKAVEIAKDFCEIAVVTAASDEFCKNNMNIKGGVQASVEAVKPTVQKALDNGIKVRGYISTIFKGPTIKQGKDKIPGADVAPEIVADVAVQLKEMGCYEISLGDTTGAGDPDKTNKLFNELFARGLTADELAGHFHDTGGTAIANVAVAYGKYGITKFDTASGGLGMCKFSGDPKGNLPTENLLAWANVNNIEHGLDKEKTVRASNFVLNEVGKRSPSFTYNKLAEELGLPEVKVKLPAIGTRVQKPTEGPYAAYDELYIKVDEEGIAHVALNSDHTNAFGSELIAEIDDAFKKLAKDNSVKGVIFSGNGKMFSAGAKLQYMESMSGFSFDENFKDAMGLATMLETLHTFPKPLVGRVQGSAIGGGIGLMATCDAAAISYVTNVAFAEVNLGLRPSTISSYCIPKMGIDNARILFHTGQFFGAEDAVKIGLASDLVIHNDELDTKTLELVRYGIANGKKSLRDRSAAIRDKTADYVIEPNKPYEVRAEMNNLIDNVVKLYKDESPEGREKLMITTATDIANARASEEAKIKLPKRIEELKAAAAARLA